MGTGRYSLAGCGTQTAGLAFSGSTIEQLMSTATEEYDGSAWTGGGNMGTTRGSLAGAGITNCRFSFWW
jgi:hypothetical protein